jgi:iron complex transport system ATP-binding protein
MAADETLIDVRNLSFAVRGRRILEDISLALHRRERVALLGPNGAGKTTLLKCLTRLYSDWTGRVSVGGKALQAYRQRDLARWISYVPQADRCAAPFTVDEFVKMGRYPYTGPFSVLSEADHRAIEQAFELTDTNIFRDRPLHTLSGGERQMVLVTAALAQEARILLLDEPTVFLDPRHEQDICMILARANREQEIAILMVTHNINLATMTSDRIIGMKAGRVVFTGTSGQFMTNAVLERIYDKTFQFVDHPQTGVPIVIPEAI